MYDDLWWGWVYQLELPKELSVFWMEVTLAALADGQRSTGLALSISVCTSRCLCLTDSNDFVSEVTFESVVVGFQKVLKKKKKKRILKYLVQVTQKNGRDLIREWRKWISKCLCCLLLLHEGAGEGKMSPFAPKSQQSEVWWNYPRLLSERNTCARSLRLKTDWRYLY